MSRPANKGNFTQTLLMAAVIFLGLQLFMMSSRPPADNRPADEYMKAVRTEVAEIKSEAARRSVPIATIIKEREAGNKQLQVRLQIPSVSVEQAQEVMRYQNELGLDLTIAQYLHFYQKKVQETAEKEKWPAEKREQAEILGLLLTADTQYRQGVARSLSNRQDQAFLTLQGPAHQYVGDPSWEKTLYTLPALKGGEPRETTADAFFKDLVGKLSVRSKTDLVLGMIPGYAIIDALVKMTGSVPAFSYAFAALLLAAIVRGSVWPLAQKQYKFGRQMSQLQPLVKEIKERYTDKKTKQITDPQEFQRKTMDLYREYGINPLAGCLPTFIQIPFFLIIYQCMVAYRFEFQNGTFLWINPSTASATNGFIAPNLGERDYLLIGIYAISMIVTTLLTPVSDPTNVKQQRMMGVGIAIFFSIMMFFWPLPSAFVLYWVFTNLFATGQMLHIYRQPAPPLVKVNVPATGGVVPIDITRTNGSKPQSKGTPVRHRPKKK